MNMIFNASAGTGKTYQVTELYSALVLGEKNPHLPEERDPVSPEKILLMTFTDNAAAELRERVSGKMIKVERDALHHDGELADRARRVLRTLPAANISTIHAFCASLIREHALDLGFSPTFQTLDDEERDTLLNEVLKQEIFKTLEHDADFREFCSGVSVLGDGDYSLLQTIRSLLEKSSSRGIDLSAAEEMLPPATPTVTRSDFERIYTELTESGLSQKSVLDAIDALSLFLADFTNFRLAEALPKFGRVTAVKHLSEELADLKETFLVESLYGDKFKMFQSFARCLARCAQAVAEAKRTRDVVDFGDQLLFARDLLKTRSADGSPFEWIIVDEVQDTSRVQCEVIEALWSPSTHLVVCGDKKQSIYAWRSADPDVMPDLERAMRKRDGFKEVPLKKSFRSKDLVLRAVNELFEGVYSDYEAAALEPVERIGAVTKAEKPCVEFLMPAEETDGTQEEMAAVARRIRLLVDGAEEWRPNIGHNGEIFVPGEPVRYGDILILLKRSTHQPALEKALRAVGIPYTSGGKGAALFEQQEVRDLLLFLQVLVQPMNDLALVGYLRSPFANVPDDEIVAWGWDGETFDHEILRRQFFEGGSVVAERLMYYREQVACKLPSQLVREMVSETAFDAHWAGEPEGEQKLANFKKALDWLRAAERGGQTLIGDVVRRFEKAIKSPPKSGAAEALLPDPNQNAVTLMTVHGAKGLTKRVCVVPDISFGRVSEKGFASLSPEGRLEFNLSDLRGRNVKSPGWDMDREADKAVRDIESENVFYVAMTRARDLVILSGAGTQRVSGWLKMAQGFLDGASEKILKKRYFSEIPEMPVVAPDVPISEGGVFSPMVVPDGIERRPVTSLCKKDSVSGSHSSSILNPALFGTLGHAALEALAKQGWPAGEVARVVESLCAEMGSVEVDLLVPQLEAACAVMQVETEGANALFEEVPFVMKCGGLILDGSIDLLVQYSNEWKIFDYKFSKEAPEVALHQYRPQLEAYQNAVERLHPGDRVTTALVMIGEDVRVVPLD